MNATTEEQIIESLNNIAERLEALESKEEKVILNNSLSINTGTQSVSLAGNVCINDIQRKVFEILREIQPTNSKKGGTYLG